MLHAIVILHGWGSSSKRWAVVKELLENRGYKVFAPDLPGFGENSAPEHPWSVADYAEWMYQWTEQQNLSEFCLVGHSFGGGVAAVFAAKYPKKVILLVLVSAAIIRRKTIKKYIYFVISKIGGILFSLPLLSFFRTPAQKVLYKLTGVSDYLTPRVQRSPVLRETFKKIVSEDVSFYLSRIKAYTLILWGEKDNVTPLPNAYLIRKALPNSILEIIAQENHDLNIKAPQELVEKIDHFLKRPSL